MKSIISLLTITIVLTILFLAGCGGGGSNTVNPAIPNPATNTPTPLPVPSATTISGQTQNIFDSSAIPSTINYDGTDYPTDKNGNFSISVTNQEATITSNSTITRSFFPDPIDQNILLIPSDHNMDQFWALIKWVSYNDKETILNENNTIRWEEAPHIVIFQQMNDGTDMTNHAEQFVICLENVIGYGIPTISDITYEVINQKPSDYPNWIVVDSEKDTGRINKFGYIGVNFTDKLPNNLGGYYSTSRDQATFKNGGITIWNYATPNTLLFRRICYHEFLHIIGFGGHPNENTDNWEISVMNQRNSEGNFNDQSDTPSESDIKNLKIIYNREPRMFPPDNNSITISSNKFGTNLFQHFDEIK